MPRYTSVCPYCGNLDNNGNILNESEYEYRERILYDPVKETKVRFIEVYCVNCGKTLSINPK